MKVTIGGISAACFEFPQRRAKFPAQSREGSRTPHGKRRCCEP